MSEGRLKNQACDRLERLLEAVCEEVATEAEFLELQSILRDDSQALEKYVGRLRLCADLYGVVEDGALYNQYLDKHVVRGEANCDACQPARAVSATARGWRLTDSRSLLLLAASLAVLSLLIPSMQSWLNSKGVSQASATAKPLAVTPVVAYMTSTNGCDWSGATPWLRAAGNSVQVGDEIALNEGIAEFRLQNGVFLSIEGPAGLVFASPNSLVLQYGKLTAHVPWPNREYRVLAGACRIEAADAEFGVWVMGGRTDIHVFAGEVLASNALVSAGGDEPRAPALVPSYRAFNKGIISQGHYASVENRNNNVLKAVRAGEANPSLFATKLSMAGPLPVSQAYVDRILADGPLSYWRFESEQNGIVTNEVAGGSELSIIGKVRLIELAENRVAELPPGIDGYLYSRAAMDSLANSDYSFEVWVKPSHVHYGTILGLCPSQPVTAFGNAFLLEVQGTGVQPGRANFGYPNSIRFLHRDPPARDALLGTNCWSNDPYLVRRWQHFVAVKRGPQMELYVDGNLAAEARDESSLAAGQRLVVGRQALSVDSRLQFIGQLDELAVYDRALTLKEIGVHYKLIEWTHVQKPLL